MTILNIIYYIGIASCGMQGAKIAIQKQLNIYQLLLCSFFSAFAGGLLRDMCLLNTYPIVFSISCVPDILIALSSALLYQQKLCSKKNIDLFIILTDSVGLAQFITIGVDRSLSLKDSYELAAISGICTSLGGGFVSNSFTNERFFKAIFSNMLYKLIDIVGTVMYVILKKNNIDQIYAQSIIVLFTLVFETLTNPTIINELKSLATKMLNSSKPFGTYTNWSFILVIVKFSFLCKQFCGKLVRASVLPTRPPVINRQRTFLYHKLRQM